tara:strand:- start:789 stop:899 length:111 start_codon:yes stop_codon:yes gene_type:complete
MKEKEFKFGRLLWLLFFVTVFLAFISFILDRFFLAY